MSCTKNGTNFSLLASVLAAEILLSPESKTLFQNQLAEFSCETRGGDFSIWRVIGFQSGDIPPEIHRTSTTTDSGSTLLTLTIPAIVRYNGTKLQCVTGKIGETPVESENVTLIIQGITYNHMLQSSYGYILWQVCCQQ